MKTKIFKQTLSIILLVLFGWNTAQAELPDWKNDQGVARYGEIRTEKRSISNFTALKIRSCIKVYLEQGDSPSITFRANQKLMPHMTARLVGQMLELYLDENRLRGDFVAEVYLTVPHLNSISISGACDLKGRRNANFGNGTDSFDLTVSGSSDVEGLNIRCEDFQLVASGACDMENMNIDCLIGTIKTSGSCDVEMNMNATDRVDARISGASDVEVRGKSQLLKLQVSGAADVDMRKLHAEEGVVSVSGAATVYTGIANHIRYTLSGSADLTNYGRATIDSGSRAGTVSDFRQK